MSWEVVLVPVVAALAAFIFGQARERSHRAREDLVRWKPQRFEVYRELWAVAGEWEALALDVGSRPATGRWREVDLLRVRDLDRRLNIAIAGARLVAGSWNGD